MESNTPVIWFKSYPDPQDSFAGSLWIAIHTQIYNYMHINDYIIRINKIDSLISYRDYLGFLEEDNALEKISSAVNRNLKKLKIQEFKFSLSMDNDPQKALAYMKKGRSLVIGIPYRDAGKFTGYNTINTGISGDIMYYMVAVNDGNDVYFIPGIEGVEVKTSIENLYDQYRHIIGRMEFDKFMDYCVANREIIKVVYASVLTRTGEEVRSLNEY